MVWKLYIASDSDGMKTEIVEAPTAEMATDPSSVELRDDQYIVFCAALLGGVKE